MNLGNQTQKIIKISLWRLLIISIAILLSTVIACYFQAEWHAYADINYAGQIHIKADDTGYLYGNIGDMSTYAETLQEAIDTISANVSEFVQIYFENVETDEALTLSDKTYYFSGKLTSTKTHFNAPVITVKNGKLQMNGFVLEAITSAVLVKEDAEFVLNGSQIIVNCDSTSYSAYAINADGKATLTSGRVELNSSKTSGSALLQGNPNSEIVIGEKDSTKDISIIGNSACIFNVGTVEINSGVFEATYPTYSTPTQSGNTSSGFAILISSDSVVTVNGGTFKSVTPTNTISLKGNQNAKLIFNGGEVEGEIRIYHKNDSSSVVLDGKTVKATNGVGVIIKANEGSLTPENAILSSYNENGYKFTAWFTADGKLEDKDVVFSDLPDGEISIISNNEYEISFVVGDEIVRETLVYGKEYDLTEYAPTCPIGFSIDGWKKDGEFIEGNTFIVTGLNEIKANLVLENPTVQNIENVNRIYDAKTFNLTAVASHEIAMLSYVWEKLDSDSEEFIACGNGSVLELINVTDSGTYRCKVTGEFKGYTSEIYSNEIIVVCEKANYEDIPSVNIGGTYSKYKTLKDFELPSGFTWLNPNVIPVVNTTEYEAIYSFNNENYIEQVVTVELKLEKGNVLDDYGIVYPHDGFNSAVYSPNKTLADYELAENYYWIDPTEIPVCNKTYYGIYYNPDRDNYANYETAVIINLSKATYTNVENVVATTSYKDNLSLYDLRDQLPDGYSFADRAPAWVKLTVGESEHDLLYNADPVNYENYIDAKIIVTVTKGTPIFSGRSPFTGAYNSNTTLAYYEFYDGENLRWVDGTIVPELGEHTFDAIYNPDSELFNDLIVKIKVIITKGASEDFDNNYTVEATYHDALKLADITLKKGYRFAEPETSIYAGLNQRFSAYFNPNPEIYADARLIITVSVNKGILSLEGFKFEDLTVVYNGLPQSIEYTGILPQCVELAEYQNNGQTNAGNYEVVCILRQTDLDNYEPINTTYTAILTIEKAPCGIVGDSSQTFVYDGKIKQAEVTLNNKEQTLSSDKENNFVDIGTYKIVFTANETANYKCGELEVTVIINKASISDEKDGITASMVSETQGFDEDSILTLTVIEQNRKSLIIDVELSGNCPEGSKIIIHASSSNYDMSKLTSVKVNGEEISYEIDAVTNDLIIDSAYLGKLELSFNKAKSTYALAISLSVVAGAIIIGIVVYFVVSKRRKKNETE